MNYMIRDPEKRVNVSAAVPGVQSILTLGVSYFQGPLPDKPGPSYGRVARYAWGVDYHTVILNRLNKFLHFLDEVIGEKGRITCAIDTKPIFGEGVG